jgi:hypothetical protein
MTTKFMVANSITGECIGSDLVRPLVGVLKKWVKEGMGEGSLIFPQKMDRSVMNYFRKVVRDNRIFTCDLCGCEQKAMDLRSICDSNDVCMVVLCHECDGGKR